MDFFLFGTEFAATGGNDGYSKEKTRLSGALLHFMAVSAGLLWFYIRSEREYQAGPHSIWQLLPYFWFGLTIAWAVLVFYYQKLTLKSQNTDALTGGPNERAFRMAVEKRMGAGGEAFAFAVIDIKKFSRIENWYDHAVGDQVLKRVYEALRSCLKENEVLCRASADQYYLLLEEPDPDALLKRLLALDDSVYFLEDLPIKENYFCLWERTRPQGSRIPLPTRWTAPITAGRKALTAMIGTAIWKSTAIRSRITGTETEDTTNRRRRL